jgi:hypothetical protein
VDLALSRKPWATGMVIAARMTMMVITTNISVRVKPDERVRVDGFIK